MTGATDFELVSAVAHELKTPVAAVRNASAALRAGAVTQADGQQRLLSVIATAADQLARLVDDLLAAGRLEAGRFEVHAEPCVLSAVVAQAVEATEAAAGAAMSIHVHVDERERVVADPGRLRQVLTNLLDNAIAHGGGSVAIRASLASGGRVRIAVTDSGPGIPAGERTRVFEPFHRLAGGSVRGTGLGLYLARELVEAMNGTIAVEDAPGGGTAIVIELPAA